MFLHTIPKTLCGALIVLVLALISAPASADVIYSNLGTPQSFDPNNGWVVDGGVVAGQQLAVAFTPSSNEQFQQAQVAMGIIFSNVQMPIDMYLASDANGLPGNQISDLTLGNGQSIGPFPPGNLATFVCNGSCPILSAAKQYWLVAQIPNNGPDWFNSQAEWNWNVNQDSGNKNFAYNDTQFNTGWLYSSELRPAFEVDGTPYVPEPGTLLLITSGVAALFGKLRRRVD